MARRLKAATPLVRVGDKKLPVRTKAQEAKYFRSTPKNGEALAIDIRADIWDLLFADPILPNEEADGACIVHVRGPLEHHNCGYGDSYEGLRVRFGEALAAAKEKGHCVILKMDSPGGVVSGLNQAVYDMTRAKKNMGAHVIVYVDELCASAAYALACVADEIILPPSGIAGSIGVISHMYDTVKRDKAEGINFVVITSGSQKSDGHEHVSISEEAITREKSRVKKLAQQFFGIVKSSRGIDADALDAGVFLGDEAVEAGIADAVMGWEQLLVDVREEYGNNSTQGQPGSASPGTHQEANMIVALRKMIADTKKKLAATNLKPNRRAALSAQLAHYQETLKAYKKTYKKVTEEEEEEGGNDTDREEGDEAEDDMPGDEPEHDDEEEESEEEAEDEPSDEDAEDEPAEEEAAAGAEDEPPFKKKEKKASKKAHKSEEEEEEAIAAALGNLTGRARGALAARLEKAKRFDALQGDVAKLKSERIKEKKVALIGNALRSNRITAQHSKMLATKPISFVRGFLDMHKKPIFNAPEEGYVPMDRGNPAGVTDPRAMHKYDEGQMAMFRRTAAAKGCTVEDAIAIYEKNPMQANGLAVGPKFTPNGANGAPERN